MTRRRLLGRPASCVLVVLAICGCAEGDDGAGELTVSEVADRYGLDMERPGPPEPLIALLPGFHHPHDDYARELLVSSCMRQAGYDLPAREPFASEVFDPRTFERISSIEVASRYGYSQDPEESAHSLAQMSNLNVALDALDDRGHAEMEMCIADAREQLAEPNQQLAERILSTSHIDARATLAAAPEAEAWRTCMLASGIGDLPSNPFDMPPQSVVVPLEGPDLQPRAPDAREIEIAVADVECREASGFAEALQAAIATIQLSMIGADLEQFDALRAQSRRHLEQIEATVAQLRG